MKKILLLLAFIALAGISSAQTFTPKIVNRSLKTKFDLLKTNSVNEDYTIPMFLHTPALQLTFTQAEKIDGNWRLTTPIYVGYSYIFTYANGVVHQDNSITVENRFFFGGGFNLGVTPNVNGTLVGSVPVGAIVGYSHYGLFGGINVITGKPIVAVSFNLLNVPILQSLTKMKIRQ
jgi:hypothetical protein